MATLIRHVGSLALFHNPMVSRCYANNLGETARLPSAGIPPALIPAAVWEKSHIV